MSASREQLEPELPTEAGVLAYDGAGNAKLTPIQMSLAEPSLKGRIMGDGKGWEDYQTDGMEAYDQAHERRLTSGLDEETVDLYKKAAADLLAADVWFGPAERPANPFNMLTRAACLAWQAEATPPGTFYEDGSHNVDVKANLQELAAKELDRAEGLLLGRGGDAGALAGELTAVTPLEAIAEASVEAAEEAGTGEHVAVRGIGTVDEGTPQLLEAEGPEALRRFTDEHAREPRQGPEFIGLAAEKIVEHLSTEEHELPLAA